MSTKKNMPLNWCSSMKKKWKIRIIFDIENWLWKSEIGFFGSLDLERVLIWQNLKCYLVCNLYVYLQLCPTRKTVLLKLLVDEMRRADHSVWWGIQCRQLAKLYLSSYYCYYDFCDLDLCSSVDWVPRLLPNFWLSYQFGGLWGTLCRDVASDSPMSCN